MNEHNRILAAKLLKRAQEEALKEGGTLGKDGVPLIETICPACRASLPTSYIELDASRCCPSCGKLVVPLIPVGTKMYMPAWGMTYGKFCRCFTHDVYWNEVRPLMKAWYDYNYEVIDGAIKITNSNGHAIDPFELHLKIQADEDQQYDLYQAYMNIAR